MTVVMQISLTRTYTPCIMAHQCIDSEHSASGNPAREAELFSALGHPIRLRLLSLLADGPCCACELEPQFDLNQSTVSRHLATLQRAGVLSSHKEGVKVIYRVRDERVWEIAELARVVADDALRGSLSEEARTR